MPDLNAPELVFVVAAVLVVLAVLIGPWPPNWKRRRHARKQKTARRVFDKLASIEHAAQKLAYLRKIDPLVFEELVLEACERRGHEVFRSSSYSGDGGIDGRITVHGRPFLVQCKRYANHVRRQHVLDFAAILEQRQIQGLFCHTGRTGAFARDFQKTHPYLTIISGDQLIDLLTLPEALRRQPVQ